ncbi:MAG TPA: metal ABC transporter permease [Oligoflexia bacterium]|nr:metal ABC transporter permease [Oligoflexia bacterium]HMP47783.1 metal ABC transporter permease [Oligoflexia bacterium]
MLQRIIENFVWELDGWIIIISSLVALNTALLGNFLVLRKLSMVGDAISHAVLPGLALAFIIFASREGSLMLLFAAIFGILTVLASELLRSKAGVDEGAALGVVFVSFFALGLVLIVKASEIVDLDPSCVLFGSVELAALSRVDFSIFESIHISVPPSSIRLSLLLLINSIFVYFLYKELVLSSFDYKFAKAQNRKPQLLHYVLLSLVALTAVISFEIVGNILVVAMFVIPPAAAHLLTNRLNVIIWISLIFSVFVSFCGHLSAVLFPSIFGFGSTSTAGMIASISGILFILLLFFSPRTGIIIRIIALLRMRFQIAMDDYLAAWYRFEESVSANEQDNLSQKNLITNNRSFFLLSRVMGYLKSYDNLKDHFVLGARGRKRAERIISNHRLWELYLNQEAGITLQDVHDHADGFEHHTNLLLQGNLRTDTQSAKKDPHGKIIP